MAFVASTVLVVIGSATAESATYIAAYGVVTRLLGLAFLPQMAIALTTQSITGNNVGAGRPDRAGAALRLAMGAAFLWCLGVALAGAFASAPMGALFSKDPHVVAAVAGVLRPMTALYVVSGPVLVLALHFQAMGHPLRTAALTLIKPWLLTPVLLVALNALYGIDGLWFAFPVADGVVFLLALTLVLRGRPAPPAPSTSSAKEEAA